MASFQNVQCWADRVNIFDVSFQMRFCDLDDVKWTPGPILDGENGQFGNDFLLRPQDCCHANGRPVKQFFFFFWRRMLGQPFYAPSRSGEREDSSGWRMELDDLLPQFSMRTACSYQNCTEPSNTLCMLVYLHASFYILLPNVCMYFYSHDLYCLGQIGTTFPLGLM